MFRFWVAGVAFFSLAALTNGLTIGAETFGSSSTNSSSTSTVTDLSFSSAILTPTKNATSSFSGATGLGTVVPLNQTWSAPAARPLSFSSTGTPVATAASTVPSDLVLWTDARRSATPYVGPSTLPVTSSVVNPSSAIYFTPLKAGLFSSPAPVH